MLKYLWVFSLATGEYFNALNSEIWRNNTNIFEENSLCVFNSEGVQKSNAFESPKARSNSVAIVFKKLNCFASAPQGPFSPINWISVVFVFFSFCLIFLKPNYVVAMHSSHFVLTISHKCVSFCDSFVLWMWCRLMVGAMFNSNLAQFKEWISFKVPNFRCADNTTAQSMKCIVRHVLNSMSVRNDYTARVQRQQWTKKKSVHFYTFVSSEHVRDDSGRNDRYKWIYI